MFPGIGDPEELHATEVLGLGLRLVLGFLCGHGEHRVLSHLGRVSLPRIV